MPHLDGRYTGFSMPLDSERQQAESIPCLAVSSKGAVVSEPGALIVDDFLTPEQELEILRQLTPPNFSE